MAKKRSSRKQARAKSRRPATATAPAVRQAAAPQATTPKGAPPATKEVDFKTEYRYVLADLKRIGVVAACMFATLIVLALVIR
jgi:hypothetical protein